MGEYHKLSCSGNLTHEPEPSLHPTGTPVCEVSLAVHCRCRLDDKTREGVSYIDIVVLGQLGRGARIIFTKARGGWPVDAATLADTEGKKRSKDDRAVPGQRPLGAVRQ